MRTVKVCIEVDEADYRAYEAEAKHEGITVEALLERMVRGLYDELKQEEKTDDHPVFFP